jgi:hypothetical protein
MFTKKSTKKSTSQTIHISQSTNIFKFPTTYLESQVSKMGG